MKALVLAAEYDAGPEEPRLFNIGYGEGFSLNQIVAEIKKAVDMPVQVQYTPGLTEVDVPVNVFSMFPWRRAIWNGSPPPICMRG